MLLNSTRAMFWRTCFKVVRFAALITSTFAISTTAFADDKQSDPKNIHIRTLAASCAACHGTNGNSHSITPVLAGLDANYFSTQMRAFKQHNRSSTVMHHHASGLTDTEVNQLANYFSQQKRITPPALTSEVLRDAP